MLPALRVLGMLLLVVSCESESLKPPVVPDEQTLYWALTLDHHAVTLSTTSPYNRLPVVATPRNYHGDPLSGLPAPQYVSTDLEKVAVTPDGVLVAVTPTSQPVVVRAVLTVGNLKHQDSVFIKVVNDPAPPVLASLSIDPIPPDSAKVASSISTDGSGGTGSSKTLPVQATDATGASLAGLLVNFRSSDTTIAKFSNRTDLLGGRVTGVRQGSVNIYASATAFGVRKVDTLPFRVGWPIAISVPTGHPSRPGAFPLGSFSRPEVWVGTGAQVTWNVRGYDFLELFTLAGVEVEAVDITFNDADLPNIVAPTSLFCSFLFDDCGSGNARIGGGVIPSPFTGLVPLPLFAHRVFSVPGTYEYRSQIHGTRGRIVVVDER